MEDKLAQQPSHLAQLVGRLVGVEPSSCLRDCRSSSKRCSQFFAGIPSPSRDAASAPCQQHARSDAVGAIKRASASIKFKSRFIVAVSARSAPYVRHVDR